MYCKRDGTMSEEPTTVSNLDVVSIVFRVGDDSGEDLCNFTSFDNDRYINYEHRRHGREVLRFHVRYYACDDESKRLTFSNHTQSFGDVKAHELSFLHQEQYDYVKDLFKQMPCQSPLKHTRERLKPKMDPFYLPPIMTRSYVKFGMMDKDRNNTEDHLFRYSKSADKYKFYHLQRTPCNINAIEYHNVQGESGASLTVKYELHVQTVEFQVRLFPVRPFLRVIYSMLETNFRRRRPIDLSLIHI